MSNVYEKIAGGTLAKLGLLDKESIQAAADLLARIEGTDLETVRVLFADQHGILRGKTIVAEAFISAFTSGIAVPSTLLLKDTSHRTVFPIWTADTGVAGMMAGAGDIVLVPDPDTFRHLEWTDNSAWIFCTPVFKSGENIPFASRSVLQAAIDRLESSGVSLVVGLEVEFHVFEILDPMKIGRAHV